MSVATTLTATSRPALSPHARLKQDSARNGWVLLGPERVLMLDEVAREVLGLCDGSTSIDSIATTLAERHSAPREVVLGDVVEMLQGLCDKGLLTA